MGAGIDLQVVPAQGLAAVGTLGIKCGHDQIEQDPNRTGDQCAKETFQAADDEDHQHGGKKGYGNGEF